MRRNVPWLLTCKKFYLQREMIEHYLAYLETRKKHATGETAERTIALIEQLEVRIKKQFKIQ